MAVAKTASAATGAAGPRWDGRRVLFEVADGGGGRVACAISADALQDLVGERRYRPADLLAAFAAARGRIEAIALGKLHARPGTPPGAVLHIWSSDVEEDLPPEVGASEAEAAAPRGLGKA